MRRGTRRFSPTLVGLFVVAAVLPLGSPTGAAAVSTELFFSEYIEGSSNNKALEIFNGTGTTVDLSDGAYNVLMFFNGSTVAGLTINLTGPTDSVANGDVYVLAQSSASAAILAQADQTNGSGWFNGDDAVVLRRGTTVIDSIGQVGLDPGTEWGSGLTSTADNTLRRRVSVESGDTNTTDPFDPSAQWEGFATDTFGGLGNHARIVVGCPAVTGTAGTAIDAPVTATDASGTVVDIAITAVSPSDPGTFSRTAFTPAAGSGETATATFTASAATPAGTYTLTLTASNDDDPAATSTCALVITVTPQEACGDAATYIHDIQGTGTTAAQTGVRTIEGIVVGDYQGPGQFSGYYVQEEDADADTNALTSEGIFVFNTSFAVSLGDLVRVRGTAGEFSGLTQLSSVSATSICPPGGSVTPTSVTLPVAAVSDLEQFEGMKVDIAQELTVTEVFTLARFGEVALSVGGRLDNPTNVVAPGAPAVALQNLNNRSRILLDDGNNQQNIDPTFYPQGGLSAANTLRVGDTLPGLTGVLDQRFGAYRVQPIDTGAINFTHANPRPAAPDPVGGNVQAAAFNVLNYFNGDGAGGGFPTARGASTPFEFNRQRAKIVAAITALDADVIGLMELENDVTAGATVGAIEDLVAGLNAAAGTDKWSFIDTGVVGTDAIRVGIIYQPAVVTPVGSHAIIDSSVDPRFIDTLNRPSIAQTFALTANGARFTAVVNHLKSKGSDCNHVGDPDTGDGQGNCNLTRTMAAAAMVDWLASDPTGSGDPDFLLLGDMNAYAMEDPITTFRNAGFVNMIAEFLGGHAYSFVFQGQSGYLDHALASPSLAEQVSAVTEWHVNADEPIALDYNVEFKSPNHVNTLYDDGPYRSSDHDPVLIGLDLDAAPVVTSLTGPGAAVQVGTTQNFEATFTDANEDDTHSTTWDWGDGSPDTVHSSATSPDAATHSYAAPGFYAVTFTVTDSVGLSDSETLQVIVFNPNGGHVSGSATYAGGGTLSQSVKYSASNVLEGSAAVTAPGVNFSATSFDWLVTSGNRATYAGAGTLNGAGGYRFVISVLDGGSPATKDRVHVQITDEDGDVVYDTQPGDPIDAAPTTPGTSGNLTVHKGK